jgi:hypothetical protein
MRHVVVAALAVLCSGCVDFGGNTGPVEGINVTGTWVGELRVALGADTLIAPARFQLQHARNSDDVDVTVQFAPLGDLELVERDGGVGSVELIVQTRHDGTELCAEHVQTWEFRIFPSELDLRNVRGTMCEELGGGEVRVRTITDGSGKLSR